MNLYKEVVNHEVFPAMGCTEPISIAYCASLAAEGILEPIEEIRFLVNQGTFKNGLAVNIPNTGGEKGNLIAGVLGALIARPEREMEILREVTPGQLEQAHRLIEAKKAHIDVEPHTTDFYVKTQVKTASHSSLCIISGSHTSIIYRERDGEVLIDRQGPDHSSGSTYKEILRNLTLPELVTLAESIDEEDMAYLRQGIEMNLAISKEGITLKKVGYYLLDLMKKGFLLDDIFSSTKIMTACAVDARMDGMALPVMSSGGSGNQGIVATLVPYNVGKYFHVDEPTILKSIALSHLLNSYVKVFVGELAPICGCAIAAGVGATCGIVYQKLGADIPAMSFAINNIISDIGGMICDGAKSGCALKVVSSSDSAIRAAYLGLHYYGITGKEGFVGLTAEETIRNLSRISGTGMAMMDDTIVQIMLKKSQQG